MLAEAKILEGKMFPSWKGISTTKLEMKPNSPGNTFPLVLQVNLFQDQNFLSLEIISFLHGNIIFERQWYFEEKYKNASKF